MDHSWRHQPPTQGNICPTCSISHFPFCPPRPPFNQNPRFPPHHNHSFQTPFFDPFPDHNRQAVDPHRPFHGIPGDGFGDPRGWHRNPSLERDPYGQFHGQSQIGETAMNRDGFSPPRYGSGSVGYKRMRVDEAGVGSFTNESHMNPSRFSTENERRLKLIREHGGASSMLGMSTGFDIETKGYIQERSVFDNNFSSIDGGEHMKFDELRSGGDDTALKHPRNSEMNSFRDPGFGSFDRKGMSFHPERGFNQHNYREEHGLAYAPQYVRSNRNEEPGQSRYSQVENSLHSSLQSSGHSGVVAGGSTNVKQGRQGQDVTVLYHEGVQYNSNYGDDFLSSEHKGEFNLQSHVSQSQSLPYPTVEVPNENYYDRDFRRGYPPEAMSAKESQHSHPTMWQGLSGSGAPYHEQIGNFPMEENHNSNNQMLLRPKHDFPSPGQPSNRRPSLEVNVPAQDGNGGAIGHQSLSKRGGYVPISTGSSMVLENIITMQVSQLFDVQPPLPASPPPPLPVDPPRHSLSESLASASSPQKSSSLFPIPISYSTTVPSSYPPVPDQSFGQPYFQNKPLLHVSTGFANEDPQATHRTSSNKYLVEDQPFRVMSSDNPEVVDASHIFMQPHRVERPDHFVIILRGLPGSGKSYLAKMLRDLEVENGGDAPRIHSMDDYFMTEVEKVEGIDASRSSGSVRGKKPVTKKVMEYCYEPEMEEAYRSSMLKAFKKTLEEGVFSFIIVDDRNLRVADFAQFWATAKRSGYEVYLLEATYKDPAGCTARNVHGFTREEIQRMAGQWEEAPSLYLKLDIKSLFHGDDLKESTIQEVDMDTEDGDSDGGISGLEKINPEITVHPAGDNGPDGDRKIKKWLTYSR
ncbi:uncharacterized protein LOC132283996 isoform X2 [Cornus florida]|uniref:uncharacterized protein LOC132283996 isoform X2 n=1 Tax=Cornus florida TaxID=4283 RepID=UPI00289C0D9B|nr:uncharacterized protein LOC132283996 isoform X2 [Cornus florida]